MTVKECASCLPWLRELSKAKTKTQRDRILRQSPKKLMKVLREITRHTISGKIKFTGTRKEGLRRYKNTLRKYAGISSKDLKSQKRMLIQKGGFLPQLLVPVISILASAIAKKLIK